MLTMALRDGLNIAIAPVWPTHCHIRGIGNSVLVAPDLHILGATVIQRPFSFAS